MKKFTLQLLFLFISLSGYSQMALETFESPAAPTGTLPQTWGLGTGGWSIFEENTPTTVGSGQSWGTNAFAAGLGYLSPTCANVSREQIGSGGISKDYLSTPSVLIPTNGELHFFTRMFTSGNQGTIYQIRVAPASASPTDPAAYTTLAAQWTETDLTAVYNVYEEKIVDLAAFAGTNVYVSFVKIFTQPDGNIGGDRWLVDNASIQTKCAVPTGLVANGITVNGASLNWANPSGATSWEIEIILATATPTGVGTVYNGTLPYVVTGLLPNTAYKYYVRALCSTGYTSAWSTVSPTFTTGTAPPECGGNFVDPGGSSANYGNNANVTTTICPTIPGQQVTITFTSFNTENGFDFLKIYDGDNATATLLGNFSGATLPPSFTSSAASGCLTFVFTSDGTVNAAGWVANITCAPAPTCPKPTALTSTAVTSNSATFGWTNNGPATAWQVIALPCGSPAPTASTPGWIDTTTNPYVFTSLTSSTCYNFYVRAICSVSDVSDISGPTIATTQAAPPVCGGNFVDNGGATANYLNSSNVTTTICPTIPGQLVTVTFTSFFTEATWDGLYVYNGNTVTPSALLPSTNPASNVPGGLAGSYWGNLTGVNLPGPFTSTSPDGCLTFVFRSDGFVNDPGWNSIITCNPPPTCSKPITMTTSGLTATSVNFGWTQPANPDTSIPTAWQVLALPCGSPTPTASTPGWIDTTTNPYAFTGLTPATCYDLYVRAICPPTDSSTIAGPTTITTPATCSVPTTLTTSALTFNSVNFGWTQPANPDSSIATAWQVIALPCGSPTPTATTPGWIDTTTNSYAFTGLTPATCYDLFVRAICSLTDSSTVVELSSITTQVAPPVCGGNFVDNGGATANYLNSSNVTTTICPSIPGEVVTVTFTSFFTEATWDGLYVYNGNTVTPGALLSSANPVGNATGPLTIPGSYWGNLTGANLPGPFTSTSANGCLTFVFKSDPSINNPGWNSNVTCAPPPTCLKPVALTATNITPTSALLGWTDTNIVPATQWEILVLPLGSPIPLPTTTGGTIVSTNPTLITGLLPATQYTFYVRAVCSDTDNSAWSTGKDFLTLIVNDECSGAIFTAVNSSAVCQQSTAGTVAGATASSGTIAPCLGTADDDAWFQFVATNPFLTVSLQNVLGSTQNLNFAVYSGTCGALTSIFCSAANALSGVANGLTIGQTYYVRVYSNGSTAQTSTFNLCISTPASCLTGESACQNLSYQNTTGISSQGTIGCLGSSPNPTYYTINIQQSGPINLLLTQSTQAPVGGVPGTPDLDVDYAAWGPFANSAAACAAIGNPPTLAPGIGVPVTQTTGCSFSALPTENLNIVNAVAGQVYVILITNYSDDPGYVSLSQTNSTSPGSGVYFCCPNAHFTYTPVSYCQQPGTPNPIAVISAGSLAGVFSSSPGLVFVNTATGEIDLQASTPGNYLVTNTIAATGSCTSKTQSYTINISAPTTATIAYSASSYCQNITDLQAVTQTGTSGGSYSATPNIGLSINPTTGAINPSLSSPGTYNVVYGLPGSICTNGNPSALVEILPAPAPLFTQVAPICPGDPLAPLPTSSNDTPTPITGTWSPAIDNAQTTTYTFTPDAGQCASTTTMTISVGSITPTFSGVAGICPGATLAPLPTTSNNGITGTWSPALNNTQTTTYTFTPTSGACVSSATLTIQVLTPTIVPTFNAIPPICPNGVINALPTTSLNGITGTWAPALDNTQTTTYTFTPDTGQCGLTTTLTIIVNPPLVVSVNNPTFCPGSSATVVATPAIPGTYTYTWTVPVGVTNPGNVASFTTTVAGTYSVVIDQVSSFCNTDFESPLATGASPNLVNETLVPCWDTTAADGIIELWPPGFEGVTAYSGNQLIELNANTVGTLFQDFSVIPGTTMSVSFAHRGRQGNDVVGVEIGPVGGPYVSLGNFTDGNTAWGLHSVNYTIPTGSGNNYTLRFVSVSSTGGDPSVGNLLDSISISALSCTSAQAVGIVSFQTLSDPTVTVTDPTCSVQTGTIEVTSPLNSAGGLPSNLFISEVTDSNAGSLTYIEIYNGTGAPVDLSNYKLRTFNNGSSTVTGSCDNTLTGILNNNSSHVVAVGSATNQGGVTPNEVFATCSGVNIDDNIRLSTTSDVDVDIWGTVDGTTFTPAGQPGYTYRRNNSATLPSTTFNAADWTALDPEDYTNVGSYALSSSTYEYSLDGGTYQAGTTFSGALVTSGVHTITVHNLTTGCYSLPFNVTVGPIVGTVPSVTTFTYTTPVCQNATTNPIPDTSATGFVTGGTFSATPAATIDINATTGEITLANTTAGTYIVTYAVGLNTTTCQSAGSTDFTIVINPIVNPVLGFSYTSPICQNATATLSPTLDAGFTSGGTFTSTTGLSIDGTTGVINLANSTAGSYTITYTSNANTASCLVSGTNTATIVINPVITPVTTFNYDTPFCASSGSESPNLGTGFSTGGTFSSTAGLIIDASTGVIDLSSTPGSYTITYSVAANAGICQVAASGTTQIMIIPPVTIELTGGCQSVSYILTASGSFNQETASYIWHDSDGAIVGNTQSITVTATGTYTVTVNVDGCDTVSLPFDVDSVFCNIQKGISVNNDGLNDTFDLTGFDVKKLTIFNRLGTKVYSRSGYVNEWGGKSDDGDELPDGTYYYVIDRNNGDTKTGWIYINRAQ